MSFQGNPDASEVTSKRPFDKKKYRDNKYNNKLKVQRFQEKREKSMKMKYFRMLKKEGGKNPNLEPLGQSKSQADQPQSSKADKVTFKKAKLEFERRQKQAERKQKEEDRKQKYLDRQKAMKAYKDKKAEKMKVLGKKTRKGQPLMAGRMELLYQKIKAQESQ